MNNNILLISEQQVKDLSVIQLNVDPKLLRTSIQDVQVIKLLPVLGLDVYNKVIDQLYQKTVDSNYTVEPIISTLYTDYIIPYLVHCVLQDYVITTTYRFTNKGILKFNDTYATSLTPSELEYAKSYHDNKISSFKSALLRFIDENKLVECKQDSSITEEASGWFLE